MPHPPPSARRLQAAMAALGRRPNPSSSPWQLQRRHAEGGDWWTVEEASTRAMALDWIAGPPERPDYGDLLRLESPRGETAGFWVMGRSSLRDAGRVPPFFGIQGYDWEQAWESPLEPADRLLQNADRADLRRFVLAAADCVEEALDVVPPEETRPAEALAGARAWTRGEATAKEARRAADEARELLITDSEDARRIALSDVAQAAAFVATAPGDYLRDTAPYARSNLIAAVQLAAAARLVPTMLAERAARREMNRQQRQGGAAEYGRAAAEYGRTARTTRERTHDALIQLAPRIRRWIPVPIALLARAGEPTPLELGF